MYIHKITSGDRKQYQKFLLRKSVREGAIVRKETYANLSNWTSEQLQKLEEAIQMKRRCRGTMLEREADLWIHALVKANNTNSAPSSDWQLLCGLSRRCG